MTTKSYILFDGVCDLCNGSVNFVLDRDEEQMFVFGTLQSEEGKALIKRFGAEDKEMNSILLFDSDSEGVQRVLRESDAIIEIVSRLPGIWAMARILRIIPRVLRDSVYRWVARNRYQWFGQRDVCRIASPDLQDRFIAPLRSVAEVQNTSE